MDSVVDVPEDDVVHIVDVRPQRGPAEAVDEAGADLAVHGHAHRGTEHGTTAGGVRVRNVAVPVIDRAFAPYRLSPV